MITVEITYKPENSEETINVKKDFNLLNDSIRYLNLELNFDRQYNNLGILETRNGKLYITAKNIQLKIPRPREDNGEIKYYKNYLIPKEYKEEFQIGCLQIKIIRLLDNKIRFQSNFRDTVVYNAMNASYNYCEFTKNDCEIPKLFGRELGRFPGKIFKSNEEPEDCSISTKHCYCGYDSKKDLFYLIDFGSTGKGSLNGTFAQLTKSTREIVENSEFVIETEYNRIQLSIVFN